MVICWTTVDLLLKFSVVCHMTKDRFELTFTFYVAHHNLISIIIIWSLHFFSIFTFDKFISIIFSSLHSSIFLFLVFLFFRFLFLKLSDSPPTGRDTNAEVGIELLTNQITPIYWPRHLRKHIYQRLWMILIQRENRFVTYWKKLQVSHKCQASQKWQLKINLPIGIMIFLKWPSKFTGPIPGHQ